MRKMRNYYAKEWRGFYLLCLSLLLCSVSVENIRAQEKKPSLYGARSVATSLPSGYSQVGSTKLYYCQSTAIDIIGLYNSMYYSSTFADAGYKVAMQVGNNSAISVNCLNGTTNNGVTFSSSIVEQGDLAKIVYTLTNSNTEDVYVSLGVHADVKIGDNDRAPISRRMDTLGNTYGLTMKDGNGAQLCVLFGSGLTGVTAVSDFWFGYYYLNQDYSAMVGNYASGDNYMEENGSYDSGMGWCWKDRTIMAGDSIELSWLIGVGEVNLEPNSNFEVTPDDPDGWNDLSRPHRLTLNGSYESPAGLSGVIDYAVEDSEEWIALTDTLESGDTFTASLVATFTPDKESHIIRFRTRDLVGNTTMLLPIEYQDVSYHTVSGIEDKIYTGDSLLQAALVCDLDSGLYVAKNYQNNVNVGTASFNIEGVFPYTIGRKTYSFTINPAELEGEVVIVDSSFVYNGSYQTPDWSFTEPVNDTLKIGVDYEFMLADNLLPGEATLSIVGKGNYTGTLSSTFTIDKAPLTESLYWLQLPQTDITYDELPHGASVQVADGVGDATLYYISEETLESSTEQPASPGNYTIHLEIADGTLYYGKPKTQVGSFCIYHFDETEWNLLQSVHSSLIQKGWSKPWDLSQGIKSVSTIDGITIKEGHVYGIDLSGTNLSGEFPVECFSFTQLQILDLSNNSLSGKIEDVAAFTTQYSDCMQNITEINISGNQFDGNVGVFAQAFPNLESLNASNNKIEEVYPMISSNVSTLELHSQEMEKVVDVHLREMNEDIETLFTKLPTILSYNHEQQAYTSSINLYCSTEDGWSIILSLQDDRIEIPYVSEQNAYKGNTGDTLAVSLSDDDDMTLRMKLEFDNGDANFDGSVNILDLQATINYTMEDYEARPYNFTATNLWNDNQINIQDIIRLVDLLINTQYVSQESVTRTQTRSQIARSSNNATLSVENGELVLNTGCPVAAFDITLKGLKATDVQESLDLAGFTCVTKESAKGVRIIGYSISGTTIPCGANVIATLKSKPSFIQDVMLSDNEANEIPVQVTSSPTHISNIGIMHSTEPTIYDLQGRRVNGDVLKGIYIQNGRKIIKK